jgi:hypothetical protein
MKLKIKFTDFWNDWNKKEGNFFYQVLSEKYEIEFADDPDILVYSNFGKEYLKYDCIKIFFSTENWRPDFSGCDFAITFDFLERENHFRFPLYGMYCDPELLLGVKTKEELYKEWDQKKRFCCMVVSNAYSKKRIKFFHQLSKYKQVDSGGKYLNNVGGPVENKLAFISEYKFVFAFENAAYPGYTTEKVIEPLQVGSIPIYWGNPLVGKDINTRRIINYSDYRNADELIQDLLALEKDTERAISILSQPSFPDDKVPSYVDRSNLLSFFDHAIDSIGKTTPVAKTKKRIIHNINLKATDIKRRFMGKLVKIR